jgi:hypothetical protein
MTEPAFDDILNWLKQEDNENVLDQTKVVRVSNYLCNVTTAHDCILKILLIYFSV